VAVWRGALPHAQTPSTVGEGLVRLVFSLVQAGIENVVFFNHCDEMSEWSLKFYSLHEIEESD